MIDALVDNAGDEQQVKEARRKEKYIRKNELADVREVLAIPAGRRLLWRLMKHCKVWESVWHPSALIHYNSGQQDVGHFLLTEISEAQPTALVDMIIENQKET
jgi:hypothetical protein